MSNPTSSYGTHLRGVGLFESDENGRSYAHKMRKKLNRSDGEGQTARQTENNIPGEKNQV